MYVLSSLNIINVSLIYAFNQNVSCKAIYSTLASGSAAAFVLSIIPGKL